MIGFTFGGSTTLVDLQTARYDGANMSFLGVADALTLGNVVTGIDRSATWISVGR